jgi:trk system potassium uptake protein
MKKFFVIGLGRFGEHVARQLYSDRHEVVAIDEDEERIRRIANHATQAILLDATDSESLFDLGIKECEACIVATGDRISTSILICSSLSELGVKRIVVKALDNEHGKVLKKVGASQIIYPEKDSAIRLASTLSRTNLIDFIPLSEGIELQQIEATGELVGQDLKTLNLRARYGVQLVAVKEQFTERLLPLPPADYVIKPHSTLVLIGPQKALRELESLMGE